MFENQVVVMMMMMMIYWTWRDKETSFWTIDNLAISL